MRNYRVISRQNNLSSWGIGKSQIPKNKIVQTEFLPSVMDTLNLMLKGTFIFEDVIFSFSDDNFTISINKSDVMEISDTLFLNENIEINKNSYNNTNEEVLSQINENIIITKL